MYDGLPFESSIQVIYFEGNMRDGPDELMNRAVRLEPHPLDSVRTGTETHHEEAKLLEMGFTGTNDGRWNTDVVVTPAELRRDRWRFVTQSAGRPQANRRGVGYWIGCGFDQGRICF
jgi:hypothetical protein